MKKFLKFLKIGFGIILGIYKNEDFINLIKKIFDFLVQEFGFSMEENITYKYSYDGVGNITYYSNNFIIEIYKGRVDDLSIKIKSLYVSPQIKLHFGSIIEYKTNREFTMENFQKSLSGNTEERLPIKIVQYAELF